VHVQEQANLSIELRAVWMIERKNLLTDYTYHITSYRTACRYKCVLTEFTSTLAGNCNGMPL
jgi:hypothetical protein